MEIANLLERPAGEIVVGFLLIATGSVLYIFKIPHADEAIVSGLTLIGRAMIGSARQPQTPPSTVATLNAPTPLA